MVVSFFFVEWMGMIVKSVLSCVIMVMGRYDPFVIMFMLVVV